MLGIRFTEDTLLRLVTKQTSTCRSVVALPLDILFGLTVPSWVHTLVVQRASIQALLLTGHLL
jgi:hypothetical protein